MENLDGAPTPFPTAPPPQPQDQLTVVESVYHLPYGLEASAFDSRFARKLQTREQCYHRRCMATTDWQKLDFGWLNDCSMLRLCNLEGTHWDRNPTEEELADVNRRVIELSYDRCGHCWYILPGESFRGSPSAPDLLVRSQHQTARYVLTLIPL